MQNKRPPQARSKSGDRQVLGRRRFCKISEVEGIRLSGTMKRAFAEFDRVGLSAEQRRQSIIDRFKGRAG
jgi:hypothetical protein